MAVLPLVIFTVQPEQSQVCAQPVLSVTGRCHCPDIAIFNDTAALNLNNITIFFGKVSHRD